MCVSSPYFGCEARATRFPYCEPVCGPDFWLPAAWQAAGRGATCKLRFLFAAHTIILGDFAAGRNREDAWKRRS